MEELQRISGAADGYVAEGFRVVTADRESFLAEAVIGAGTVDGPRRTAGPVRRLFTDSVE
ncbi:hypothetical protein [Streptomyces sp. BBFR102]|uniref:hypothetical protein n=1 Tax=Streptomyces sp. BBFR102 TaxID=3448171 RepID=UPI003F53D617